MTMKAKILAMSKSRIFRAFDVWYTDAALCHAHNFYSAQRQVFQLILLCDEPLLK